MYNCARITHYTYSAVRVQGRNKRQNRYRTNYFSPNGDKKHKKRKKKPSEEVGGWRLEVSGWRVGGW